MKKLLLCVLFMGFPTLTALRYNHKTMMYYTTNPRMRVDENDYHVLALTVKSALDGAYEAGGSMRRTMDAVLEALLDNGSPAALQLADDLEYMFD